MAAAVTQLRDPLRRLESCAEGQACAAHLRNSAVMQRCDGFRRRVTIAELVEEAIRPDSLTSRRAVETLDAHGLKIAEYGGRLWLGVGNRAEGLRRIFAGTPFGIFSGRYFGWTLGLRALNGARPYGALRFDGRASRATLVPLHIVFPAFDPHTRVFTYG